MPNQTEGIRLPEAYKKADDVAEKYDKLTDRQKQLVVRLVADGLPVSRAADELGANRSWAYTALRKQHVSDYMAELREASMGALRSRAVAEAHKLLSDGSSRQRLELVQTILGSEEKKQGQGTQAVQVNINLGE